MDKITKKPWQSDTIVIAGFVFICLITEIFVSRYWLNMPILDDGTRATIFVGILGSVGFRFKTNQGIKF